MPEHFSSLLHMYGSGQAFMIRKVEAAWAAREEKMNYLKERLLPLEVIHLFHSELADGTGQRKVEVARSAPTSIRRASRKGALCLFGMLGL
jgi:hypothetical protein